MLVRMESPVLPVLPPVRRFMPWEPMELGSMLSWDPLREVAPIFEPELELRFVPSFDVKETKEAFVFKADLPGIAEKDIEMSLAGNYLTVSGKREEEKEEKGEVYCTCERSYGVFTRSFTLPEGVDLEHVAAELKDGVLTIVAPKKAELKPHKISIKGLIGKITGGKEEETKAV